MTPPPYAFVERVADLEFVPAGARVVAVTPESEVACLLRGIPFESLVDDVDAVEIEELGADGFELAERLCELLDARYPEPLTPARWHFYPLKVLRDGLWLRALLLGRWLDAHEISAAVSFPSRTLFGRTLALVLAERGIPREEHGPPLPAAPPPGQERREGVRRSLRRLVQRRRALLALDHHYSLPAIATELERRGQRLGIVDLPPLRWELGTELWQAACADPEIRELFRWDGVDYWPVAETDLRPLVEEAFPSSVARYDSSRRFFARARARAVLLSVAADPAERVLCAAAAAEGVATVVSRHGELGMRDVRMVVYQDADVVSTALCWGAFEAAWIERHVQRRVELRIVGSPHGELAAGAPERRTIRAACGVQEDESVVVYVPQPAAGDDWYVSNRLRPDVLNLRWQQSVLRSLVAQDRFAVLVKEHPAADTSLEEWCDRELPGRVRFLREHVFAEVVHLGDAVVIDSPSTSLVQALFGSARILVPDDPIMVWSPGVREHLASWGVLFLQPDGLASELVTLELRDEPYPQEAREPLLASGPGTAAERAAAAVLEIAGLR